MNVFSFLDFAGIVRSSKIISVHNCEAVCQFSFGAEM